MNAAAALGRHLNVRIQVRSFEAVCRMVGSGAGLGLVPRSALSTGGLIAPPATIELDECPIEELNRKISSETGFVIIGHSMELTGLCPKCQ